MDKLIIPQSLEATKKISQDEIKHHVENSSVFFEPEKGAMVKVITWVQYPSYDYIFGIPTEDSPRAEKEVAFFVYRDGREGKHYGQYYDLQELLIMQSGFSELLKLQKEII